jgi:hypothetical protein
MHDIYVGSVAIDISLTTFIKALYPTYSHYLESLQASGQLKSLVFYSLMEKIVKCEKYFKRMKVQPIAETMCLAKKGKNQSHDSSRGECSKRGCGNIFFRGRG